MVGGLKSCSNDPGHVTNMVAMPIYGKKPYKSYQDPNWPRP